MQNVNSHKIRRPAVAGTFYPEGKNELNSLIENFLHLAETEYKRSFLSRLSQNYADNTQNDPEGKPSASYGAGAEIKGGKIKALIAPHAGYVYSGQVAAFGYQLLRNSRNTADIKQKNAETLTQNNADIKRKYAENFQRNSAWYQRLSAIVIVGPSHHIFIDKPYADQNAFWLTPLGKISVNQNLIKKLGVKINSEAHEQEHSIEVQLPFLQYMTRINADKHADKRGYCDDFSIVPIVLNKTDDNLTEKLIQINDDALIIASSDLSHFLPYKEAVEIDKKTIKAILDFNEKAFLNLGENTACGAAGILTLMKIAKKLNWQPILLKYQNSGDTAGDKSRVVGYVSIVFLD